MSIFKRIVALKHNKLFRGIALWICIQAILVGFGFDSTFADNLGDAIQEKVYTYNSILNVLYLLLRPALTLAGMALDNSMVYGWFLNLDAPLRLIWNIVKNIANFTLWFMVLFEILKNFFTTEKQGENAFKIIKKALIAWVLIQSSWFILAAIIDVSTITTYAIGGLPISALKTQCEDIGNTKILWIGSKIDFSIQNTNSTIDNSFMYYSYAGQWANKKNFAPCVVKNNKRVVWQKYRWTVGNITFQDNYCILSNNQFAYFGNGQLANDSLILGQYSLPDPVDSNQIYQTNLSSLMELTGNQQLFSGWAASELIFNIWSWWSMTANDPADPGIYILNSVIDSQTFVDVFAGAPELKNILDQAEWFVGVLITLYKSILNFASFNTSSGSTDTFVMFLEILLKTVFGIAMLVPLIVTAVALIIRIWFIWMFIALSPIIALRVAFEKVWWDEDSRIKSILESIPIIWWDLSWILRIIFAPVLICFAVSICMIFMNVLITSLRNETASACITDRTTIWKSFNIDPMSPTATNPNGSYQINGLAEVQQSAFWLDIQEWTKDIFGWFLINIFGAAMTWLILMTVIEIVFKGTVVDKWNLGKIAWNALWSFPIIPVPTKEGMQFIGAGTAAKIGGEWATAISNYTNPQTQADKILWRGTEPTKTTDTWTTSTSSIISAAPINDEKQENALVWGIATNGINNLDAATLFPDNDDLKWASKQSLQKSVFINPTVRTKLAEKIKEQPDNSKLNEINNWFAANTGTFTKNEIEELWKATDPLAKQLSPYIPDPNNPATIRTSEWWFKVTFNSNDWTYEFTEDNWVATAFTTLLGKSPAVTDRTESRINLMK